MTYCEICGELSDNLICDNCTEDLNIGYEIDGGEFLDEIEELSNLLSIDFSEEQELVYLVAEDNIQDNTEIDL